MWHNPEPRSRRALLVVVPCALLVLGAAAAFIPVERTLSCTCQIDATERWTFNELRPGTFQSRSVDNVSGRTTFYRLFQFDRPSFLELQTEYRGGLPTADRRASGARLCEAGEVVAHISSSALNIEMAERTSDLHEAHAFLDALEGGAKPETIERARVAVEQASTSIESHELTHKRHRELYEAGLVAASVWEETAGRHDLLQVGMRLAEAELQVLEAGARPQDIIAAEVAVAACERELNAVQAMMVDQDVRVPIAGELRQGSDPGALLSAVRLDSVVVRMLIAQSDGHLPSPGQSFRTYLPGTTPESRSGRVVRVDHRILITEAGPFLTVYGTLENDERIFAEGMEGFVRIHCGRTTLLEQFWEGVRRTWNREMMAM